MSGDDSVLGQALRVGSATAVLSLALALIAGVGSYAASEQLRADAPAAAAGGSVIASASTAHALSPTARDRPAAAMASTPADRAIGDPEDVPRAYIAPSIHETPQLLSLLEARTFDPPRQVEPPAAALAFDATEGTPDTQTPAPAPFPLAGGDRVQVTVSFYYCVRTNPAAAGGDGGGFCGATYDGTQVAPGVAACDRHYLGQRFRIEGDPLGLIYRCADTGSAVGGLHRDIWFNTASAGWAWSSAVGRLAVIEILP